MMRSLKTMILGLALIAGCDDAAAGDGLPPAEGPEAPPPPKLPELDSFAKGAGSTAVDRYVGSVHSKARVEVATEMSGTLADVAYDEGDRVEKGAVLFRLKAQTAKLSLTQSRKGLEAAKRRVAQAERELARIQELHAAGAATAAALDAAQSAYDNASIAVEQAEVAVDMGKTGIGDTLSRAPISGIVVERYKDPGEAVTSMPPTVVLVIEDLSVLEVRVRIPELDLRHVEPGTKLQASFPALDLTREIKVARIGSSVDPATRTIEIIAEVDNPDLRLKPGMSVEVVPAAADDADGEAESGPEADAAEDGDAAEAQPPTEAKKPNEAK